MAEKDDGLGLSLSLRIRPENLNPNLPPPPPMAAAPPFPLNLFGSPLPFIHHQQKTSTTDAFQSTSHARDEENRSVLFRGIDVNRSEAVIINKCEKEAMVSSPNSTVSSLSGKRSEREENYEDDGEMDDGEMDDEDGGDAAARKKLRLCKEQATVLEETFREHNTLNPKLKMALAKQLNLSPRQVEVWFQNRRARTKLKQTEVDCEHLRRCYDNLTDENKRLQKEVNELRALKRSPQFYMNICPPTTLTMCPQCEHVAAVSGVSSSSLSSSATTSGGAAICRLTPGQHRQPAVPWGAIVPPQKIDAHRR